MAIFPATGDPTPEAALRTAMEALTDGLVIGLPTDTVYGLAVDPFQRGATDRVFAAKRRPRGVALPLLVAGIDQVLDLVTVVPAAATRLMECFWPGPLTIVLPRRPGIPADLGDDGTTVGVRFPDHPVPQALCAKIGPLATTSANRHGEPTSVTAGDVAAVFGDDVPVVLDGGRCAGAPSTVVDCTGSDPRLLREGRIPWEHVQAMSGGRR